MTKCQEKKPAEIQYGNNRGRPDKSAKEKEQTLTMFSEIPHDKQPKCEAKTTDLSKNGPHS